MFQGRSLCKKVSGQGQKNVVGPTFPTYFPKLILIFYGLLKMSQGQQFPDLDPEIINAICEL
jgi:hypothetical protein